jgi:hypothetical protein
MTYIFRYRRKLFWHSHKVIGHMLDKDQGKMILYFPDGGVQEIVNWKDCEIRLGSDWKVAQQKALEEKAGQSIPLKV